MCEKRVCDGCKEKTWEVEMTFIDDYGYCIFCMIELERENQL